MDLKTTFQSATFTGNITAAEEDFIYSRVTVYYSDAEDFNIHNASSASTQAFDYNGNFSLTIYGLDCSKKYKYCFFIESAASEAYGSVMELELGYNVELGYKTGEYAKTGYYSSSTTSSIINGYAVPVLKSHMPEKIEGLEFYIKGSTERTQPLIAYIGYMTDPTKASTLTKIKSCTTNVMITKSYSKVMLHLDVSRMELSAVPEDGEFYVGFYPPLKYADIPLGIGHTAKTDSGYIETEGFKGIYSYVTISNGKYTWGVPSSKQPRYVGLLVPGN
jgi:hypothetical protein